MTDVDRGKLEKKTGPSSNWCLVRTQLLNNVYVKLEQGSQFCVNVLQNGNTVERKISECFRSWCVVYVSQMRSKIKKLWFVELGE